MTNSNKNRGSNLKWAKQESKEDVDNKNKDKIKIDKNIRCDQCIYNTSDNRNLRMHMKYTHDGPNGITPYVCQLCQMTTKSKGALDYHKRTKHKQILKCVQCEFTTLAPNAIKTHMLRKHGIAEMYKCDRCVEQFNNKTSLTRHKTKHDGSSKQSGSKREASKLVEPLPKIKKYYNKMSPKTKKISTSSDSVIVGDGFKSIDKAAKDTSENKVDTAELIVKTTELPKIVGFCLPEHKNSRMHITLGDGSCCLRCVAAHLEQNGEKGPTYSRNLNKHMSHHRGEYRKKMSFPKIVYKGRGQMKTTFGDTEAEIDRFFDWLGSNEDATFLWRESADMIAISNYYNMEIEVVKIDSSGEVELPTQQYEPDTRGF
jgi:hypothetical protein